MACKNEHLIEDLNSSAELSFGSAWEHLHPILMVELRIEVKQAI